MIDLKHLRTLLALRKTGNLTKAAEMLCLTQSALSQQIRLLESDYGTLFERKTVPIAFTAGRPLPAGTGRQNLSGH